MTNPRPEFKTLAHAHRVMSHVKRFHTEHTLFTQNLAEHVFGVMRIYMAIWGPPDEATFKELIYHDFEEVYLGDLPHWAGKIKSLKAAYRNAETEVRRLYSAELPMEGCPTYYRVKVCDYIEALEFMLNEAMFSNQGIRGKMHRLYREFLNYCEEKLSTEESELVNNYLVDTEFDHNYNLIVDGVI